MKDEKRKPSWVVFLAVVAGLVLLLYLLRSLLAPLIIAALIAYAFNPLVNRLEKLKVSRSFAIILLSLVIVVGTGLVLIYTLTVMKAEILIFWQRLPQYSQTYEQKLQPWIVSTFGWDIPKDFQGILEQAQEKLKDPDIIKPLSAYLAKSLTNFITFFLDLLSLLIIPVFSYYLLSDYHNFSRRLEPYVPMRHRSRFQNILGEIDLVLGGFIRGQLLVCLIIGVLTSTGLLLIGVDLAVIIGMTAGFGNIIPYFGFIAGITIASLMAFLQFGDLMHPLMVVGVFALVQALEGFFISPRIVGDKMGLNPMIIIAGLVIGGNLFGFVGILLAVPGMAVLKVVLKQLTDSYLRSSFYRGR